MTMREQYERGQEIFVDPGVFIASPSIHKRTEPCVVVDDAGPAHSQVYISRISNGDTLYVFKHRTSATKEE